MSKVPNEGTKTCTRCKVEQDYYEFRPYEHTDRRGTRRNYRQSWCRDCELEYARAYQAKAKSRTCGNLPANT